MELHELTIPELHNALINEETKVDELIAHFQGRIKKVNGKLNAFLDTEVEQPGVIDMDASMLAGIPFAVKDVIVLAGHICRGSSKILEGYRSPYTATVLKKLLEADGVVVGRTNCDEFAMGGSNENSAFGPVHNPWELDHVPGGSSGGSAAAVAAGLVPYALGSDTGGSIREPASFCGIVGVKPTYGRVSRFGLMALTSSFDTIGSFTPTVEDAAIVMESISGFDQMDATTVNIPVPKYTEYLEKGIKGLRVGIPKEYFGKGIAPGVENAVKEAIRKLEDLGAEIIEVSLPSTEYSLATYYIILPVEASANLSKYDGIKYGFRSVGAKGLAEIYKLSRGQGFGEEVKRRIMLGAYASSSGYYDAYYKQALKARDYIKSDFKKVFESVDCLATPTVPTPAFKIGEKIDDPLQMYLSDVMTVGANISGVPGISIPCGFDNGLPVGLQIIAPWFKEEIMFQVAGAYEKSTDWHKSKPPLW